VETEVVAIEEVTETETIEPPAPDASEPDFNEALTETEEAPKKGFFSKLFGKKDTVDSTPTQSGISSAVPRKITTSENAYVPAPGAEIEVPEEIVSPDMVTPEPEVVETEAAEIEVVTYAADSAPAGQQLESSTEIVTTVAQLDSAKTATQLPAELPLAEPELELEVEVEPEASIEVIADDELQQKGFFSRLFDSKNKDNTEEDSGSEEVVEIDTPEESIIIAKLEEPEEVLIESVDVTPDAINTGVASDIWPLAVKGVIRCMCLNLLTSGHWAQQKFFH